MSSARDDILKNVQLATGRRPGSPVAPIPPTARIAPRAPGDAEVELVQLLAEIGKLSGVTRRLANRDELRSALADLVAAERVTKATLWATAELAAWGVAEALRALGVEIVPAQADKHLVAACELGVTGVDAALPETGTLQLCSSPERPRVVSLLPRVHLAIFTPAVVRADLHDVFASAKDSGYSVFVTGPSRTSDIELTLTLGVHGPKSLYAWVLNEA